MTKVTRSTYSHPVATDALDDVKAGRAYAEMAHTPFRYSVESSYLAFKHETIAQYLNIVDSHAVTPDYSLSDPPEYASSAAMFTDIDRGFLIVRPSALDDLPRNHPMNADVAPYMRGRLPEGAEVLNDIFRFVHDINGHNAARLAGVTASFGPIGERNAWLHHRQQYSQAALLALWCETRGQSAWTNALHADAPLRDRPFAEQKAGYVPAWLV